MDSQKPKLDDSALRGRLRSASQGPGYVRRPSPRPTVRIQDISNHMTKPLAGHLSGSGFSHQQPTISDVVPSAPYSPNLALQDRRRPLVLYAMASLIFIAGLAISLVGFRTNQKAQAQVKEVASVTFGDNTAAPPATSKPSAAAIRSYKVASDLPRYIDLPSLKVHARVYPVGTTKVGALEAPSNIYNVAWYKNSSKPGQAGAMLIDGHSGIGIPGVFSGLVKLKPDAVIKITRGDGKVFSYKVVKTQFYPSDNVNMASLLVSADTAKPGLNLISCSGDPIPGTYDLNKRIAIFAIQQ